jgi:predicted RNA-binding Zn ribbon-like protein
MLMRPPSGGSYHFDPGAACLEFAHTGGEAWPRDVFETLHAPHDLARWIGAWLDGPPPPVSRAVFAGGVALRNAIWNAVDARLAGSPLPPSAVAEINRPAARPPLAPEIVGDRQVGWADAPASQLASQVLSTLARDAVALLTGPHADRLRMCGAGDCYLVFVDTSRPGRRRWCSMERCGNRAKVAAFRTRQRTESSP